MTNKERQAGISLIGVVIALAIVAVLYAVVARKHLLDPGRTDRETRHALEGQGINAGNLPGAVRQAQAAADQANKLNTQMDAAAAEPAE